MNPAHEFLKTQKLMAIATSDEKGPWVANIFYGMDEGGMIYFISSENSRHSTMIKKNPVISFSVAWFDSTDHKNRKAVQGLGECRIANSIKEIGAGLKSLWDKFPEFHSIYSVEWIMKNAWGSKMWMIAPTYIKYWDDERYGEDETKEFYYGKEYGTPVVSG